MELLLRSPSAQPGDRGGGAGRNSARMPMRRQSRPGSGAMRVLIADDDRIMRHLLQRTLEQWGYTVTAVANGEEAWTAFATPDFSVGISGWGMPGVTGGGLVHRIRAPAVPGDGFAIFLA